MVSRLTTLSSERVASARVRIEPASVSRRHHPRRRVDEHVANCVRTGWPRGVTAPGLPQIRTCPH